ncbi:MAG: hypothetical protein R2769_08150 [Saprospiraceae bacterium]
MEPNLILREQIFEIIKNQIRENNPPETKITFDRLLKEGYDEFTTKQLIGQCIAVEFYEMMTQKKTFNLNRYVKNLAALPKEPM